MVRVKGSRVVGCSQGTFKEMNSGQWSTNPVSGKVKDFTQGITTAVHQPLSLHTWPSCLCYFWLHVIDNWLVNRPFNWLHVIDNWLVNKPFNSQDLTSNSPYCLPYSSCDVSHKGEIGIGSTNNPMIDISLYSHHLSAWYCIDIVRRNSVLVTHGS